MRELASDLKFEDLPSYDQVITELERKKRDFHLLFGNGFSMAYDPKIFSYNALYDFVRSLEDPNLIRVFEVIKSKNFEEIMRQLDQFIVFAIAFGIPKNIIEDLEKSRLKLQDSLIDAVSSLHPDHVFEVEETKSKMCFAFLMKFLENNGKIFSTNYDLLSYWVLMRNEAKIAIDGFGKELLNPDEIAFGGEPEFSDLEWGINKASQNIFYLHGSLPLFDTGITIIKEIYKNKKYLLENIKDRMSKKEYPIFVTSGNGNDKLSQITHNQYLTNSYNNLCEICGSLVVFGFNFGIYDKHIIEGINRASKQGKKVPDRLWSIYIGVFSEKDLEYIKSIQDKFKCKVIAYSSKTVNLWN